MKRHCSVMNLLRLRVTLLLCLSAAALGAADELGYSPDGGLVSFGEFDYVYDSASRLTEVWSNGVRVVENQYDALGRRVIKRTPEETHTFVYDGWLLVVERIERAGGQIDQIDYWWGKDISGSLYDAGGIGGLLYIRKNGLEVYVPLYDGHGNVMQYVDKQGTIVAEYTYDAFGNTIRRSGVKADELKMRFSTKYSDDESELYYFGHRFYSPRLARWLSRDPIEEDGGLNLYAYCGNGSMNNVDPYGLALLKVLTVRHGIEKPVRNIDDIFIVPLSSETLNGEFCSWADIDQCEIRLKMQIRLNERLVDNGDPNIIHYFDPHDIYGGKGGTRSSDGSPQIRGGILAHERGHASAFLHAMLPAFRRRISKFSKKRLSKSEKEEVRRIFQACREEFQPVSAARANQAQIDWYRDNGYRLERRNR